MNKLGRGEIAPAFEVTALDGTQLSLERYRGSKVWLAFFRFASCPLCNYRIHELMKHEQQLRQDGVNLIAVFQSPAETIQRYVTRHEPDFPIVPDPELKLYERYGVAPNFMAALHPGVFLTGIKALFAGIVPGKFDGPVAMVPADFLIDPEGVIYQSFYGKNVADHIPFEHVSQFAADPCLEIPAA